MEYTYTEEGKEPETDGGTGTYTYDEPNIKLTVGKDIDTATINGNKLIDSDGDTWTKK